ncbi:PTS system mannose/fructose/sorbose family transporter subunit IID, partial [Escherichia coli]|uniref:PTS system mannose/fructose/sorbose family transporter subunit IID n=1 Tax=Escherichia coli TaxID=562 RepID=UPI0020232D0C
KRAYCLKIQPATGSFARNLIYSTKPTPLVVTAGAAHVNVQTDLLDRILPNALPLALVWFMFWLVQKGKSPSALIFGTLALGVVGHVIGIF